MLLLLVFTSPGFGVPASALEYKLHVLYMLQVTRKPMHGVLLWCVLLALASGINLAK
jgi:carbamoylphosphate synthase small subunit